MTGLELTTAMFDAAINHGGGRRSAARDAT
jgi:hypothetical protein